MLSCLHPLIPLSSCNSLDVDHQPPGPQAYLMSMSQTTEPSTDGPTVSEGLGEKNKKKIYIYI